MTTSNFTKICPQCGAVLPIHFGFRTWCDHCNWNLADDHPVSTQKGLFPDVWDWLNRRDSTNPQPPDLLAARRPSFKPATALVYLVSFIVHAITVVLIGIAILWFYWVVTDLAAPRILTLGRCLGAILLLMMAWKVRPRQAGLPADTIRRADAPRLGLMPLFDLADTICQKLAAPKIDAILLSGDFFATTGLYGWKRLGSRHQVLTLGLPLALILDQQEFLALLSYALAHQVNGDPRRSWLVSSAIASLLQWADLFYLKPVQLPPSRGWGGLFGPLILAVLRLLSLFSWLMASLLAFLLYPTLHQAEFYADSLAAHLAGTDAQMNLLRKSSLRQSIDNLYLQARYNPSLHLLPELQTRLSQVPDREWLRIDRLIDQGAVRLGEALPTTRARLALLRACPPETGQMSISPVDYTQIIASFERFENKVEAGIRKSLSEVMR